MPRMGREDSYIGQWLVEFSREQDHIHAMLHRIDAKLDILLQVAEEGGSTALVKDAIAKLKASSDALQKAVDNAADSTEPERLKEGDTHVDYR